MEVRVILHEGDGLFEGSCLKQGAAGVGWCLRRFTQCYTGAAPASPTGHGLPGNTDFASLSRPAVIR